MKILFLTQYFPPEVGAPQNRLYELAVRLQKRGEQITVITAMPNYPNMQIYKGYRGKLFCKENMDGLKIIRSYIFVSKSKSIIPRLLNYFSFVKTSMIIGTFIKGKYDYVFCESPPLFLGISAYYLAKIKCAKLIFNVSDLWPESAEKLDIITNRFLLTTATRLEEFLYKKSALITGQTQGIVKNISSRFPQKKVFWLPNGVDLDAYQPSINTDWREKKGFNKDDSLLLYAGIIGIAQGLEVIMNAAEKLQSSPAIKFILVGEGPVKKELIAMKKEKQLDNVFFYDMQPKNKMPEILSSMDASIIPLKKLDLFLGAIPSKIFESLSMGIPVLLGVDGEAKELFVNEGQCALFFEPENAQMLAEKIKELNTDHSLKTRMKVNGRKYVSEKFDRNIIAEKFHNILQEG